MGKLLSRYFTESSYQTIFTVGDSKTSPGTYQTTLLKNLLGSTGFKWLKTSPRFAVGGYDTDDMATYVTANLSASYGPAPDYILINLGANDVSAMPLEADWKADYGGILDAFNIKWPSAKIYCMRVWRRGAAADCNTLAGWLATVVAARSTFAFLGPDERIFLENGDDGVTYTADGVHPNAAGYVLTATQWQTVMGY